MTVRIINADCREALRKLDAGSVHCCVTSPPYFGLRDYGHAGQIGLEDNPSTFVTEMVSVFREVRRVLRDDGTLWLNLGDSYTGSSAGQTSRRQASRTSDKLSDDAVEALGRRIGVPQGLKPKDMIGIPWRVAFALQEDGWYLRQDIIWSKPNPMPESVQDRCTKAHEYLFLLSKSQRYHYDASAIAEDGVADNAPGNRTHRGATAYADGDERHRTKVGLTAYSARERERRSRGVPPRHAAYASSDQSGLDEVERGGRRNKRSVWTVATQPFKDAHFATFPPDLIEPCIKAGCPEGGTVLDPFGGAGTTGLVADRLGRSAVLIELNPEYAAMARARIAGDGGLFADVEAA